MNYDSFTETYGLRLNPQQKEAVQTVEGNVLLLAVPGSGKTTVLVARLGYMLCCCGIAPEDILTMTYTVAATEDMKKRFVSIFGEELSRRLEFRTINGVCARIIRLYEQSFGTTAFRLITDERAISSLLTDIYRQTLNEHPTESDIRSLRSMITYAKNMRLRDEELNGLDETLKGFSKIFLSYRQALRERQLMDYDDQLLYAYTILRRYPALLERCRSRYRYLCVDEAQDSSRIQHMIVDLLSGPDGNLFMVGDEDQSIYGFRAAYPQALMDFEKNHSRARVLLMEQNYRSTRQIVSAAGRFISLNSERRQKNMTAFREDGPEPREISLGSRSSQYSYLLKVARDCERETAVLFRDNECALPLIDLLNRNGLSYRCRQFDCSFFTSRIVRDISDIIRFAQDQTNGSIFLDIYYKLSTRLTRQEAVEAVRACPESVSVLEYLAGLYSLPPFKRRQCRALLTHMNNMLSENAGSAVYRIVNYMGYGEYLQQRELGMNKVSILQALGEQENSPAALLRRLDELSEIAAKTPDTDSSFILSTIHSSKGLEYDRVFLMDVIDGILPASSTEGDGALLEEERRLFYVAMTRAKNELCVFTFQSPQLRSEFSARLFPKAAKTGRSAGGVQGIPAGGRPSAAISPPSRPAAPEPDARDYGRGAEIRHRQFGRGRITARSGDVIQVQFEGGITKKLSLSASLKGKLIRRLP